MDMRIINIGLFLLVFILTAAVSAQGQKSQEIGDVVIENWQTLTIDRDSITVTGPNARMATKDGKFEVKSPDMVVTFARGASQTGAASLKTVELQGGVWMKFNPDKDRSTEASAKSAVVDYADKQQAVLTGNVTIESKDPELFIGPATVTGDKATIDLRPGEESVKLESTTGKSKLEFTPKPSDKDSGQAESADKN